MHGLPVQGSLLCFVKAPKRTYSCALHRERGGVDDGLLPVLPGLHRATVLSVAGLYITGLIWLLIGCIFTGMLIESIFVCEY